MKTICAYTEPTPESGETPMFISLVEDVNNPGCSGSFVSFLTRARGAQLWLQTPLSREQAIAFAVAMLKHCDRRDA
jgi:hypothetical protein